MTKPLSASEIRAKYLAFFRAKGHAIIPRANLVPEGDATTLFTGSGMQPLIPYLLGEPHPLGTLLADSQTCFRAEDIDEVGDNRHTTFFEMLGNWSLGEYFKAEQLPYFFEFLTHEVGLNPKQLYVTVFLGDKAAGISRDEESAQIWKKLFADAGVEAQTAEMGSEADGSKRGMRPGERIFYYDAAKNWWSRAGVPANMPAGEPGGPDSEVFFRLSNVEHDPSFGENCHPNCDCGQFIEIGNSVFMQYVKRPDGGFDQLPQRNVDFGGGLERLAQASLDTNDMFRIDLLWPIVQKLEELSGKYQDHVEAKRVIADHIRAAVFLAVDGVVPSNTAQGYVLRRFARRAIRQGLALGIGQDLLERVAPVVAGIYQGAYPEVGKRAESVLAVLAKEERTFRQTLNKGVREFRKVAGEKLAGEAVFKLFDTYGFPPELSLEEAKSEGVEIDPAWREQFDRLMAEQRERSRTATAGQFKGGLADHSEIVTKYHTATHLMYKALRLVLGDHVIQRGSNITPERLRFDFSHPDKMTPEQIAEVERIVNEQIAKDWPMGWREEPTKEALQSGVMGAFGDRYGEVVKVYTVGDPEGPNYSREICGGPHVEHTGQLAEGGKRFKITKEESSSAGVRRIKAVLQ